MALPEHLQPEAHVVMYYTFDKRPPEPLRRLVCRWLTEHGIDPAEVAVPGAIALRWQARQIIYTTYARDQEGTVMTDEAGEPRRVQRVHQLESPPRPIPLDDPDPALVLSTFDTPPI